MAFDVEGALKAGYSEADIASYLAGQKGFDLDGARKAGYGDQDIIQHLSAAPAPAAAAKPTTEAAPLEEAGKGARSGVSALKSMWEGLGASKDANVALGYAQRLSVYDQIDRGILNKSNLTPDKVGGDMSPQFRDAQIYLASDEGKRQQLRNRAAGEIKNRKELFDTAVKTIQQYQEENKKNKGRTENLTDIEGTKDFANWLSFNLGSGAVQLAPVMTAAVLTGGAGAFATGTGMELGGQSLNRLEFILNKTKAEKDPQKRADDVLKYVQKTNDTNLMAAIAAGAVDILLGPVADIIKQPITQAVKERTRKEIAKQAAKAVPRQTAEEGVAGGTQETISIMAERALEEQGGPAFTKENVKRVVNAAAAEAVGGGGASVTLGGIRTAVGPTAEAPKAAPRVEPTIEPEAPAAPAAPPTDPRKEALVKSYIDQGFMPDDADLLATQALGGLEPAAPTAQPAAPAVAEEAPAFLPKELAGAKPRYAFGNKLFELSFESDIDRAAYISAQGTPSKRDADYVDFVTRATGMSEPEVRAHGRAVRDAIKAQARASETGGKLNVAEVGRARKPVAPPAAPQQPEVQNVPTTEPPPFVTEPSTDERGVPLPNKPAAAAEPPLSPIARGLDTARSVTGQLAGREEAERAALVEQQQQLAERAVSRGFAREPYPDLGLTLGASWVRDTLATNPTPEQYEEAAYARLEELGGLPPADARPAFERRAPAAPVVGERPEARAERPAEAAPAETLETPPAAALDQRVESQINYDGGGTYVGTTLNGEPDGQGTMVWSDGSTYVGEFKNNLFNGRGTYTYADGATYVGEFKNDLFNGRGTYTYADGSVETGIFENDELISEEPSGTKTPKAVEAKEEAPAAAKPVEAWFKGVEKVAVTPHKGKNKLVQMPIDEFLKLAERDAPGSRPDKEARVEKIISEDGKFSEVPYLYIEVDSEGNAKVTGHEGRHRARALKALGYATIPVELRSNIRWSEQQDPESSDYKQNWPTTLVGETGDAVPFPVPRDKTYPAAKPVESVKEKLFNVQRTQPEAKRGDAIRFNLPWVPGGYEVSGIVGDSVYLDRDGREVSQDSPGAKRYVNVTYKVEGDQITNPIEVEALRLNTIRFEEKPDLTKPQEKPSGTETPKAVKAKEERPAQPTEATAPLELEAGRKEELEVDPSILDTVARTSPEKLRQQLIAEFGATAAGEPRKRAPGGGAPVRETKKTEAQQVEQSTEIINLTRDTLAEISAVRKLERSTAGDYFGIAGRTSEEIAYREALRDLSLEVLRVGLYKAAQKFKARPIVAYAQAGKYLKSLKPAEQERAKALAEGREKFTTLPPLPDSLSTPAQRKKAIEKIRAAEEEAAAEPVKEARPAKEVATTAEKETEFFTTAEAEPYRKRGEEARRRAEEKGPQEKTKWTDFNARLLARAIPKSETMEAQFTEEEIADAIEDIADGTFDAKDAKKMTFDDLAALTQAAMELAAEQHTQDTDKTFAQLDTLAGALAYIAQKGTPLDAGMAEALLTGENGELIKNVSLQAVKPLREGQEPTDFHKALSGAYGAYAPSPDRTGGVVMLEDSGKKRSGLNNLVVLHEGVHAATSLKLFYIENMEAAGRLDEVDEKLLDAYDDLVKLMAQANGAGADMMRNGTLPKEVAALAAKDAFTDVHEFVAYGLTDANMKAFLLTVPGIGTKKSGLSRFISALLNLLQIGKNNASALRDLVIASGKLMEAKTPSAKAMAEAYQRSVSTVADEIKQQKKILPKAQEQSKTIKKAEEKLKVAATATEVVEQMGSLMQVAKNPSLWVDYLKVNYRNIATPVFKGYLAALPTNVLVDLAEGMSIGNVKQLNTAVQKMHTFRTKTLNKVQELAVPWIKLNAKEQKKLADVMHMATDLQIDPAKNKTNAALYTRYNALTPEAKAVYAKVRDFYKGNYDLYRALLAKRVADIPINNADRQNLMNAIKETYEVGAKIEPYFPFMRYGEYWVSFGKGVNKEFYMFESPGERDLFRDRRAAELKRSDPNIEIEAGNDIAAMRKNLQGDSANLKALFGLVDSMQVADPNIKNTLKNEIFQLHLLTLPEASFRKQFIKRKGTAGFSGDALRNFITSGTRFANQIARIKYGPEIRNSLAAAEASLEGDPDRPQKSMVTNELGLRVKDELEPDFRDTAIDKIARGVNKAAFVWLLTSVHSAANQLFSVVNFTLPTLAKYHGWGPATAQLMETVASMYTQVGTTTLDKDGNVTYTAPTMMNNRSLRLSPIEQRAYQAMLDRGIADATRTQDLFLRKGQPSATYNDKTAKIVNALGALFHTSESLSREVTFMTAFRLNIRKMPFEDAVDSAIHTVNESLFDYTPWNTPRILKSAPARVVTQFMKFPLFVSLYLARNARAIFKPMDTETRTGAAKALFGTLGLTGLLAGVSGLPMFSTLMGIAQGMRNLMADDDDEIVLEEENLMRWFRNVWLPETFGETTVMGMNLAELIDSGVLNAATGYDFAGGISLNNMWFRDAPEASNWKDAYASSVNSLLGPGVGLGESWASAVDDINKGDTLKGFEKLTPALFRGTLTAARYKIEGAMDAALRPIKEADEFTNAQLLMQAMGFKTTGLAKVMEDNFAIRQMQQKILQKRTSLISNLDRAATMDRESDFEKTMEQIDEYNAKYPSPDLRIDYDDVKRAMERRRKAMRMTERGMIQDPRFRDLEVLRERGLELIEKEAAE